MSTFLTVFRLGGGVDVYSGWEVEWVCNLLANFCLLLETLKLFETRNILSILHMKLNFLGQYNFFFDIDPNAFLVFVIG